MSTYPRIAWATAMTPSSTEHYQNLLKHKVTDVVICLHLSGFKRYETGEIHTKVARETGMRIHAGLITNLANPLEDTKCFYLVYRELNYTSDAKVSISARSSQTTFRGSFSHITDELFKMSGQTLPE